MIGEIAWAKHEWPDELGGVHFRSPVERLLAWVPGGGTVTAFVYTPDHACARAELTRGTNLEGTAAALRLTIVGRKRSEDGHALRDVSFGSAGAILEWDDDTWATQARSADGSWKLSSSGGYGSTPAQLGALTSADDRVARFAGEPLELTPHCAGPTEWLACPGGGEHPCERCDQVGLWLVRPGLSGRGYGRPIACHETCPEYPRAPAMARLRALIARVTPWRARRSSPAAVPALYRFRDDCLRDHPAASARARG